ncbi:palmitoyltransferase swf1 [Allomyces arbusculus]|nr:palmitoyltransferase swf1 [Allomyces arbusculus]
MSGAHVWLAAGAVFVLLVAIFLLGPTRACRGTPLGAAHRVLTTGVPSVLRGAALFILRPTGVAALYRLWRWIGYEKNPLTQLFFLTLVTGGGTIFFTSVEDKLPNPVLAGYHWWGFLVSMLFVYVVFIAASVSDPGFITRANHASAMQQYPYDHIMFFPTECSTCHLIKPARSKHCSMCRHCVAHLDHHCIWINNCVGQSNHWLFLLFLVSVLWLSAYGSWVALGTVIGTMVHYGWASWDTALRFYSGKYIGPRIVRYEAPWQDGLAMALALEPLLTVLGLFLVFCALLMAAFLTLHLYTTVLRGKSTNEAHKWSDIQDAIDDGQVFLTEDSKGNVYLTDDQSKPRSAQPMRNVYHRGIVQNFKDLVRLPRLTDAEVEPDRAPLVVPVVEAASPFKTAATATATPAGQGGKKAKKRTR